MELLQIQTDPEFTDPEIKLSRYSHGTANPSLLLQPVSVGHNANCKTAFNFYKFSSSTNWMQNLFPSVKTHITAPVPLCLFQRKNFQNCGSSHSSYSMLSHEARKKLSMCRNNWNVEIVRQHKHHLSHCTVSQDFFSEETHCREMWQ